MRRVVLFVCTGNYYRSRYAEERFNALAAEAGLPWRADSAGLRIDAEQRHNKGPLSADARRGLEALGTRLPEPLRMPRALLEADLTGAARVVCLQETEHRPMVVEQFPAWERRVTYWEVRDVPPSEAYDPLAEIEALVRGLLDELSAHGAADAG